MTELGQHFFQWWIVVFSALNRYQNHCRLIANWIIWTRGHQGNFNKNAVILYQERCIWRHYDLYSEMKFNSLIISSFCKKETWEHVSVHWQQGKYQLWANCFIRWMPMLNRGLENLRDTLAPNPLSLYLSPSHCLSLCPAVFLSLSPSVSICLSTFLAFLNTAKFVYYRVMIFLNTQLWIRPTFRCVGHICNAPLQVQIWSVLPRYQCKPV